MICGGCVAVFVPRARRRACVSIEMNAMKKAQSCDARSGNQISSNEIRRSVRQQASIQNKYRESDGTLRRASIENDHHRHFCSLNPVSLNPCWLQFLQTNGRCNSRMGNGCGQGLATLQRQGLRCPLLGMAAGMLDVWLPGTLNRGKRAMIRGKEPCDSHDRNDHGRKPA